MAAPSLKLADDFAEDRRWGYPKWKVVLEAGRKRPLILQKNLTK